MPNIPRCTYLSISKQINVRVIAAHRVNKMMNFQVKGLWFISNRHMTMSVVETFDRPTQQSILLQIGIKQKFNSQL